MSIFLILVLAKKYYSQNSSIYMNTIITYGLVFNSTNGCESDCKCTFIDHALFINNCQKKNLSLEKFPVLLKPNVFALTLTGIGLESIPEGIYQYPNLKELYLSNNKLNVSSKHRAVCRTLKNLKKLTRLHLVNNRYNDYVIKNLQKCVNKTMRARNSKILLYV